VLSTFGFVNDGMFAICAHNWPGKSDVNKAYTQIDSQGDSTNSV